MYFDNLIKFILVIFFVESYFWDKNLKNVIGNFSLNNCYVLSVKKTCHFFLLKMNMVISNV